MAASFTASETHGASGSPTTADNAFISLLSANIGSGTDATTNARENPVAIPGAGSAYSFERWLRGHWTGTFTSVSAIALWKNSGTLNSGFVVNLGTPGTGTYATPVATASSVATAAIPTTAGTALSLGPTTLSAAGYSYYAVVQGVIASTAASGVNPTCTWRFGWNEV